MEFEWGRIAEKRLDKAVALRWAIEKHYLEGQITVESRNWCADFLDRAIFSCYRDIEGLGDEAKLLQTRTTVAFLREFIKNPIILCKPQI